MKERGCLVKVFMCNNKAYLYDANKNRILKLSNDTYSEINRYLHAEDYSSNIICSLKKKGYLLGSEISKIEHPFTPFVEQLLRSHLSTLILQVTQNCNFRCRYCSFAHNSELSRTHTNKMMTYETARKSIDLLSTHCADTENVTISFYGGEPLLNYDLIKQCVEYSQRVIYNKAINFSMTTNFYNVTDEMIAFLVENQFDLLISLDGPEDIQNNHRRLSGNGGGTYHNVIKNVMKLKSQYKDYFYSHVQFNPVVYYDEDPMRIISYFKTVLGVSAQSVQLQRINDSELNISYDPIDTEQEQQSDAILNSKGYAQFKRALTNTDSITANYHINGSCVPGSDKLFVSVDGIFFPCEKVNESNDNMRIGSLEGGFDYDKVKYLMNIGYLNQEKCKTCWAIRFCNICCAQCDDGKSNLSREMMEKTCNLVKRESLSFLKDYITNNIQGER